MSRPGDPNAIDHAPIPVEAHVDNDAHTVVVPLWRTSILSQLVAALRADDAARAEFMVWLANAADGRRCAVAKKALEDDWRVRDALTLTLSAGAAELLAERLDEASTEPFACPADGCGNYRAHGTSLCNAHLAEQSDGLGGVTTAAGEVAEATALMRERAQQAATPGTWKLWGMTVLADQGDEYVCATGTMHIASWHPAVALAVADWLDDEAAHQFGPTEHAIAVALAYLGRES